MEGKSEGVGEKIEPARSRFEPRRQDCRRSGHFGSGAPKFLWSWPDELCDVRFQERFAAHRWWTQSKASPTPIAIQKPGMRQRVMRFMLTLLVKA